VSIRPFRFTTSMPAMDRSPRRWRDDLRRIEDLGFSSVAISDHLAGGWAMDPIVTMTVAAESTSMLRLLALVFCNDFRHPALLHRSMANLDGFSGGRVEIGLGAGWSADDYRAAGIAMSPPAERVARLAEALDVVTGLFETESLTFTGAHYRLEAMPGLPRPVQRPHPPLVVGGGGRRVLKLAGRAADIAGINPRLSAASQPADLAEDVSPRSFARKVDWVRTAAVAAGRDPDSVELQLSLLELRLRHAGGEHHWSSSLARHAGSDALTGSPAVLHGDLARCVDALHQLREQYGISYLHLGGNLAAAAPIVARLA
jgi:probable F420-dependent oxidoreductase